MFVHLSVLWNLIVNSSFMTSDLDHVSLLIINIWLHLPWMTVNVWYCMFKMNSGNYHVRFHVWLKCDFILQYMSVIMPKEPYIFFIYLCTVRCWNKSCYCVRPWLIFFFNQSNQLAQFLFEVCYIQWQIATVYYPGSQWENKVKKL